MAQWEKVCAVEEVPANGRKLVPVGVFNVLVFNSGKRYFACVNECPHLGMPLETGELAGHVVRCNSHGYQMDLTNGRCLTEAGLSLPVFPVEVREGWIWIKV
ncbi:MAG: Rieske (2Fe-2S) protein [Elusimicrobia bacterium]|nr:Rieske (2Fe-2S) protein [Elusimicrobiota bacterium]